MPTTIPYDPALVLGNLVDQKLLDNLLKIAELQEPIDTAQFELNDKLSLQNSMKATMLELTDMGIDVKALEKKSSEVSELISKAGLEYANTRIKQEELMQGLRRKIVSIHENMESPVDWNRTMIADRPLSSDSMKMDIQYFSFDENEQNTNNTLSSIKSFVTAAASSTTWGVSGSSDIATAAVKQIAQQREHHDIAGTLILTAACTHKGAKVLAPFILDVDKAVRVWNSVFSDDKDKISLRPNSAESVADTESGPQDKHLSLISGATYGSSFVGMVHILNKSATSTDQDMESLTTSLQGQFELGNWFANLSGSFGVDKTMASDIKNLLSTASVDSHVSLITTGIIPSIKSSDVATAVKQFTSFDPAAMMGQMAILANSTDADGKTMASAAASARTGGELVAWNNAKIESVIGAVSLVEAAKDKVMNVQSMMTAFEDYVDKAIAGTVGVPINFFIKHIDRSQLELMVLAKYYPHKFRQITGDDSAPSAEAGGAAPAAPPATDAPADAPAPDSGESN